MCVCVCVCVCGLSVYHVDIAQLHPTYPWQLRDNFANFPLMFGRKNIMIMLLSTRSLAKLGFCLALASYSSNGIISHNRVLCKIENC